MKNPFVSAAIGCALGLGTYCFLPDENRKIKRPALSAETEVRNNPDTDEERALKAISTTRAEARGYARVYDTPFSDGGGGAVLTAGVRREQYPEPNGLTSEDRVPIKSFYLSEAMDALTDKLAAERSGDDRCGFAEISGCDDIKIVYSITWPLVYNERDEVVPENSCDGMHYFLPDQGSPDDGTYSL